jgi:hypothetical protein
LAEGASETLERTIDHGDFQTVDPVERVTVHLASDPVAVLGELTLSSNSGVKVPKYRIVISAGNDNQVSFQIINE